MFCEISLLHARVSLVFLNHHFPLLVAVIINILSLSFLTLACVCGGGLEVGFVSACSFLALVTGVVGYVLAGVGIGGLSCIFLYFCGC